MTESYTDWAIDYFSKSSLLQEFLKPEGKSDDIFKEAIFTTSLDILDIAYSKLPMNITVTESGPLGIYHMVFDIGHRMWLTIVDVLREVCKVEVSQLSFCMVLMYMSHEGMIPAIQKDDWESATKDLIYKIINDMDDATNKSVDRDKLAKSLDNASSEDLKKFFTTFRELGTFKSSGVYQDPKDKELFDLLLGIYFKLTN